MVGYAGQWSVAVGIRIEVVQVLGDRGAVVGRVILNAREIISTPRGIFLLLIALFVSELPAPSIYLCRGSAAIQVQQKL